MSVVSFVYHFSDQWLMCVTDRKWTHIPMILLLSVGSKYLDSSWVLGQSIAGVRSMLKIPIDVIAFYLWLGSIFCTHVHSNQYRTFYISCSVCGHLANWKLGMQWFGLQVTYWRTWMWSNGRRERNIGGRSRILHIIPPHRMFIRFKENIVLYRQRKFSMRYYICVYFDGRRIHSFHLLTI